MAVFAYTSFAQGVVKFFNCVSVGTNHYLSDYPSISCDDSSYQSARKGFIVLAVFVVAGFPVYIVAGLAYARKAGYFDAKNHYIFARRFGSL